MSTENTHTQHKPGTSDRTRQESRGREQAARSRGLWWVLSMSELLTLASSWIALWLTVETVPADVGFGERNPVADALLGWSTTGLAVFVLCVLVVALLLLRMAGEQIKTRSAVLVLSMCAGAVAALNLIDAGWNVLLVTEYGTAGVVGAPGLPAMVFGLGSVAYLCAVHLYFGYD